MVKNAFTDILFNWKTFSKTQKIKRLQDLENMVSRFQGRKPRTVTTEVDEEILEIIGKGREPEACYNRNGGKIYIFDLDIESIDAIKNIIHEGFHAYVDDFVNGKVGVLKTYSKVDKERFKIEEENLDVIRDRFLEGDEKHPSEKGGFMPLFDSLYIEEQLNYQENSMYMAKYILNSIESVQDAIKMQQAMIFSLAYDVDNVLRAKKYEKEYGKKYEEIVVESLNSIEKDSENERVLTFGNFNDAIDEEFLTFYNKMVGFYRDFAVLSRHTLINEAQKQLMIEKSITDIMITYREFVRKMLKEKKKI